MPLLHLLPSLDWISISYAAASSHPHRQECSLRITFFQLPLSILMRQESLLWQSDTGMICCLIRFLQLLYAKSMNITILDSITGICVESPIRAIDLLPPLYRCPNLVIISVDCVEGFLGFSAIDLVNLFIGSRLNHLQA
jgi:hypothetical protein